MNIEDCPNFTLYLGSNDPILFVGGYPLFEENKNYDDFCALTSFKNPVPLYTTKFILFDSSRTSTGIAKRALIYKKAEYKGSIIFARFIRTKTCRLVIHEDKFKIAFDMEVYRAKKDNSYEDENTYINLEPCETEGNLVWKQTRYIDVFSKLGDFQSTKWKGYDESTINITVCPAFYHEM